MATDMLVCRSHSDLGIIREWKKDGQRIALVPTMGALHEGHLSLVRIAKQHADKVVVSIFVNPTQFAPNEDFSAYPRTMERDLDLLRAEGTTLVYTPTVADIYPDNAKAEETIDAALEAHTGLETDFRPHFFAGVRTVVRILFDQVTPDVAVFGEKDFQQLMVIREMVASENMPIEIIGASTARDADGLALSSRNAYLSAEEKKRALTLNKILFDVARTINDTKTSALLDKAKQELLTAGFDKVDYVASRWGRILAAAWMGKTRLIDNVAIDQ